MSFFFRMASRMRPSTPEEVVRSIKDSFLALPTKTGARALEEVEKNISSLRQLVSGDGEAEPNQEQVLQIALEICKEDVLSLFVQNLPSLGWGVRKDLANCWCILLGQKVDENYCCVKYIEDHVELLDFLVGCYKNLDVALNCGNMLRECIKYPTLAKYILESNSFELFFEYVELPNFDIASDALNTFKDLLTKHETVVSEFLGSHYQKIPRGGLREGVRPTCERTTDSGCGIGHKARGDVPRFRALTVEVFVANPNKPCSIVEALRDNRRELLKLLHNLPASKGEDELDEERDLIIQAIEKL